MRKLALFLLGALILSPHFAFAQSFSCSAQGYTVVFVNGIFDTKDEADTDKNKLEFYFDKIVGKNYNGETINFQLGYNQTHLAGLGDLVESYFPALDQFDLNTILLQIYPEVKTRKLMLVGHSQGADYTNAMYSYLLAHGEPREALGVYAVATPANVVAGGGMYLTSREDLTLSLLAQHAPLAHLPLPLPPNIDIPISPTDAKAFFPGHSFTEAYLAGASERVVADINSQLAALVPTLASDSGDCFTPPAQDLAYTMQKVGLAVADPAANILRNGSVSSYQLALVLGQGAVATVANAFGFFGNTVATVTLPHAPSLEKNFILIQAIYGSSLTQKQVDDLVNGTGDPSLGGAVVLAGVVKSPKIEATSSPVLMPPSPSTPPVQASTTPPQTWWTSGGGGGSSAAQIIEATTTPPAPVLFDASTTPPVLAVDACANSLSNDFCFLASTAVSVSWSAVPNATSYKVLLSGVQSVTTTENTTFVTLPDHASTTLSVLAIDASNVALTSNSQSVYVFTRPLIINEVGWMGTPTVPGNQWFELKNLTTYPLDLSGVAVVAADGSPSFSLSGSLAGQALTVFTRSNSIALSTPQMIVPFDPMSMGGEELALVHLQGAVVLDRTPAVAACGGWCAGDATGVSMERADANADGALASSWANNDQYTTNGNEFGTGIPLRATPGQENSLHLVTADAGWFCGSAAVPNIKGYALSSGEHYVPPTTGACSYFSRFIGLGAERWGGIFRGTVGSSTLVNYTDLGTSVYSNVGSDPPAMPADAQAGEPFFTVIWLGLPSFDSNNAPAFFETGVGAEPQLYRVLPWVWGL